MRFPTSQPIIVDNDGALSGRGCTAPTPGSMPVGLGTPYLPHKHVGARCGVQGPQTLLVDNHRPNGLDLLRQHGRSIHYYQCWTWSACPSSLAWKPFLGCLRHEIILSATHLPRAEDGFADALSRGRIIPMEWSLPPEVVQSIFHRPSPCRHIRDITEQPVAGLPCEVIQPACMEVGCTGLPSGQAPGLRPSIPVPYYQGPSQDREGVPQDPPHSSFLASPATVPQI